MVYSELLSQYCKLKIEAPEVLLSDTNHADGSKLEIVISLRETAMRTSTFTNVFLILHTIMTKT